MWNKLKFYSFLIHKEIAAFCKISGSIFKHLFSLPNNSSSTLSEIFNVDFLSTA